MPLTCHIPARISRMYDCSKLKLCKTVAKPSSKLAVFRSINVRRSDVFSRPYAHTTLFTKAWRIQNIDISVRREKMQTCLSKIRVAYFSVSARNTEAVCWRLTLLLTLSDLSSDGHFRLYCLYLKNTASYDVRTQLQRTSYDGERKLLAIAKLLAPIYWSLPIAESLRGCFRCNAIYRRPSCRPCSRSASSCLSVLVMGCRGRHISVQ